MAISQNFPSIAPSLSLNFASSRTLDPRITFTRTSSATCFGPNGLLKTVPANAPRFNHDPTTGESLGLLVEESRTNLLLYSEEFDDASWSAANSTIDPNTEVAPDGTLTADKQTHTGSGPRITRFSAATVATNAIFTFSFYAKAGTSSFAACSVYDGTTSGKRFWFDLSSGTPGSITNIGAGYPSATSQMQSVGNGWYRCIAVITNGSNTTVNVDGVSVCLDQNGILTPSVSGLYGYIWGAQLEEGSFPTSYIPTTTATVTRAADVASISGSNFSSWYRQDEGTVFVDAVSPPSSNTTLYRLYALSDGTTNNRIICYRNGASSLAQLLVSKAGATQASFVEANWPSSTALRVGISLKENTSIGSLGGSIEVEDTSCLIPTVDRLYIGNVETGVGSLAWNSTIKRLTYWPARLGNEVLQRITQ